MNDLSIDNEYVYTQLKEDSILINKRIQYCDSQEYLGFEFDEGHAGCIDSVLFLYFINMITPLSQVNKFSLVTGRRDNFSEYKILELMPTDTGIVINCFPDEARNYKPCRLNVDAQTYFEYDPAVQKFIGLHKNEQYITLVIPLVYNGIYYADIEFQLNYE